MKVKYGNAERAEYRYNGLNWRVVKWADSSMPPNGTLNQQRVMYYSANWQLLEERIDDDADAQQPADDRKMQYFWGPRYIDDIIARPTSPATARSLPPAPAAINGCFRTKTGTTTASRRHVKGRAMSLGICKPE